MWTESMIEQNIFRRRASNFRKSVRRFVDRETCVSAQWGKDRPSCRGKRGSRRAPKAALACYCARRTMAAWARLPLRCVVFEGKCGAPARSGPASAFTPIWWRPIASFERSAKAHGCRRWYRAKPDRLARMTELTVRRPSRAIRPAPLRDGDDFVLNGQKVIISTASLRFA